MKSAQKRSVISLVVLFSLIFSLVLPIDALADDSTPPATEPAVTDVPVTEDPVITPTPTLLPTREAPPTKAPPTQVLPTALPATGTPTAELPATEAPATAEPEEPEREDNIIPEIVKSAAETGVVLVNADGTRLVLGSVEAADALITGDPWYTSGGVEWHFSTLDCDPFTAGAQPCDNPLQAALDAAAIHPPDLLMAEDGVLRRTIYVEKDTVFNNLHLNVNTPDITLWGDPGILDGPGAGPHAPTLRGDGTGTAITINAEGFTLIGFIIENYELAIHQPVISGTNEVNILNNTIQDNKDGILIQKGTGSPGTNIHYNIFQRQSGMDLINTDSDGNNQQFVQAQNNYWGCETGPVVAYKIYKKVQGEDVFVGWGYRDWLTKHDYGLNGDGDDPNANCALLYGADKLADFQLNTGAYSPYKINLGDLLAPVCEDPDATNYGGPLPCDYTPAPTVNLEKSASPAELPEPGGTFTFTLTIHNTSVQDVTVTALSDDNPLPLACTSLIGQVIPGGGSLSCSYTVDHSAVGIYPNTASVTVQDALDRTASDTAQASVAVIDTAPLVELSKSANPTQLSEPGGEFTFTLTIHNASVEEVTITALTDSNALSASCLALIGTTLPVGGTVTCSYTVTHTEPGTYNNYASVTVQDDDGQTGSDRAEASVVVTGMAPTVELSKSADPLSLPEPGGVFTFTLSIHNTSTEPVTITALTDDNPLSAECQALVGTVIATGGTVTCSYTVTHTGPGIYHNTASVTVEDNDGQSGSDEASADVEVTETPPTVELGKSAQPPALPEPGGEFTFTLSIHNTSAEPVTITSLSDDNALSADCLALIGTIIPAGGTVTCTYSVTHTEPGNYHNSASVTVQDDDGQTGSDEASADVVVTDLLPTVDLSKSAKPSTLPEPGGEFTFTLTIHNTSVETVTITALSDSNALSAECLALVGTLIPAGGTVSCTYTVTHTEAGTYGNTANVTVEDNDGHTASDEASADVVVTDVLPTVDLTKSANPLTLPEPGGEFTFTLTIHNTSIEPVTITALTDDNALPAACLALIGTTIPAGGTVSCTYPVTHTEPGTYDNTASVTVQDNEGQTASDQASATVTVTGIPPAVDLTKSADPLTLPEPGGEFTFTLTIHNASVEPVTITALSDDNALSDECRALIGTSLPAGGTVSCTYIVPHAQPGTYPNTASVTVQDNDGETGSDQASASVEVTDVLPTVDLSKSANPAELPEPGGIFTFTLSIHNTSSEPVTITTLADDYALSEECQKLIGTILPAGGTASCTYSVTHTQAGTYGNTASVTVQDDEGNSASDEASASVVVTDVLPAIVLHKSADPAEMDQPGGVFTFTLQIVNPSVEAVTITQLADDNALSQQCLALIGTSIPAGGSVSCTYPVTHTEPGLYPNQAAVEVEDNEGNAARDSDSAQVAVLDLPPSVRLDKSVTPATMAEPGGVFHYTLEITNTSSESVRITALTDSNPLPAACTGLIGDVLVAGQSVSCSYAVTHNQTGTYDNTASVTVHDFQENTASDTDSESVTVTDLPPTVDLNKSVTPPSLPQPGGVFQFTLTITNNSVEDVTITALTDDFTLPPACTSLIGTVLSPGESVSCTYEVTYLHTGSLTNHASVIVEDDEKNTATDTGTATATVTPLYTPAEPGQPGGIIPVTGGETHAITAGTAHSCAITPEGGVICWGNNAFGQLGNGTNTGSTIPVDVLKVQGSTTITAGGNHTCVLSGSDVWCWGQNSQGQVGDGTTADRNVPVKVLSGAVDITAGLNYSCAVMLDGTVMCWGDNDQGQLADGSKRDQTRPTPAKLISGVTNIDAGQNRSCGLTAAGLLRCVNNGAGITANGLLPVAGATFEPSLDVAVDRFGSVILALDENGVPVVIKAGQSKKIEGAGNAIDVDSGFGHICALLNDGTVKCWGANSYGQLGNNSLVRSEEPQLVTGLNSAWQIAVGKNHTCVLIESSDPGTDDILCWGLNEDGQLGDGSYTSSPVPVIVK